MNYLEFFSSIIGSISWPAAIVVLVFILRPALNKLLLALTKFRYRDIEIDFRQELKHAESEAKIARLKISKKFVAPKQTIRESGQIFAEAAQLMENFPEPAVLVAWSAVEQELLSAVERLAISQDLARVHGSPSKLMSILLENGAIDKESYSVLSRMRNLRNMAAHPHGGGPVTADEAREFLALSVAVVERLRGIKQQADK